MPNETLLDIFSVDGAGLQVENYIYMYHLQEFIVLPSFVDSVQDNFGISWQPTTPLGRSAPIYSFTSAGPRTVQVTFTLHRDMMFQINKGVSDAKVDLGDDYVDTLIKDLQACVLPDYDGSSKSVNPPIVALRVGNDIFIKGVITSNLGITWNYPILSNGKYSNMIINLTISEIDPYDARTVQQTGSYRNLNLNSTLDYGTITTAVDTFYSDPFDEYGGIVGGNLANMPNQMRIQRALQQQQQSSSSINSSTLSNSYNLTRTILNNGVHPTRGRTDVAISSSSNSLLNQALDNTNLTDVQKGIVKGTLAINSVAGSQQINNDMKNFIIDNYLELPEEAHITTASGQEILTANRAETDAAMAAIANKSGFKVGADGVTLIPIN